jgi:hypothetical protein
MLHVLRTAHCCSCCRRASFVLMLACSCLRTHCPILTLVYPCCVYSCLCTHACVLLQLIEDTHTSIDMFRHGWTSRYVNEKGEHLSMCTHQPDSIAWRIKQVRAHALMGILYRGEVSKRGKSGKYKWVKEKRKLFEARQFGCNGRAQV